MPGSADAMHPLLSRQLQHYMGTDFVVPDGKMRSLFEAISEHYRQLEHLGRFDPLTGVANRRYLAEIMEAERIRSSRYGRPPSVLMMDVDRFKQINDAHGHQAGDMVLQTLCETCRIVLREVDIVGRWGGDEFVVLLPEISSVLAPQVAERLRGAVGNMELASGNSHPLNFSISIGCASCAAEDDSMEIALGFADRALYQAKHTGRNRVCVAAR